MLKKQIKYQGRLLFNQRGVRNVTLRDIAADLKKSYGNITYHYPTKEILIEAIYEDMNNDLSGLQTTIPENKNLLEYFLMLPELSFDISLNYLFFFKDFVELKRAYPGFYKKVETGNNHRKEKWRQLLQLLQVQGYLKSELDITDLNYIMELSTGIRMMYFMEKEEYEKAEYTRIVNRLLYPYLAHQHSLKKIQPS